MLSPCRGNLEPQAEATVAMAAKSYEGLQLEFLKFFEQGTLADVSVMAEGREILAHKAVLGAQSDFLRQQFQADPKSQSVELPYKYKVAQTLIRFMYFGGLQVDGLSPIDGLDMLTLGEELVVKALDGDDLKPVVLTGLTVANCVDVLNHEALHKYPTLEDGTCEFTGNHLQNMLNTSRDSLLRIPKHLLSKVLQFACHHVCSDAEASEVVKFCLAHTQIESACDLLRETKAWQWGSGSYSFMRSAPLEDGTMPAPVEEGHEWCITDVRLAMESTPSRLVIGSFFDWCIRLDYGAEGKLRLVYESATPRDAAATRCLNRFPAAMFAWRVIYKGQDIFNEKPVFICFPENVSLHWSTTLPLTAQELTDGDELQIMVEMAENPMISLVLYYFSSDLKTTVYSEDILNRLPHIEYRCLSSYSLVKTHVSDQ